MKLPSFLEHLRPHKTVPMTPWRANHPWDLSLPRVAILWLGLVFFGFGDALVIQSNLGNAPWTVLAEGLTLHSPLNLGEATFVISLIVMALWIPLKIRPGFGTISNMVLIAAAIEFGATHFPRQDTFFAGVLSAFLGVALVGVGTSLYITCGLGPGPRDGAMTGIHRVTGIRVGRVRLGIELTVFILGLLLGGRYGLGTAIFALFVGQAIAISLGILARLTRK